MANETAAHQSTPPALTSSTVSAADGPPRQTPGARRTLVSIFDHQEPHHVPAGSITVSGYGGTYRIRLYLPPHRAEVDTRSHGQSTSVQDACTSAVARMRAENGGTVRTGVEYLRKLGYEPLLDDVVMDLSTA